jgi:dienelactone hydrolase
MAALLFSVSANSQPFPPCTLNPIGDCSLSFPVAGQEQSRRAVVRPGNGSGAELPPLIIFFHGKWDGEDCVDWGPHYYMWPRGEEDAFKARLDFQAIYPEAVVVYAEGTSGSGNHLGKPCEPENGMSCCRGWAPRYPHRAITLEPPQTADLDYVDELIKQVAAILDFNEKNVFAVGYSAGAFFATSLHKLMPATFRGIVGVGMEQRYEVVDETKIKADVDLCKVAAAGAVTDPPSVLYVIGESDFAGFYGRKEDTLRSLLVRNEVGTIHSPVVADSVWKSPPWALYPREVEYIVMEGVGHCWPDGDDPSGRKPKCAWDPEGPRQDPRLWTVDFIKRNLMPYFRPPRPILRGRPSQDICSYSGPAIDGVSRAFYKPDGSSDWGQPVLANDDGAIPVSKMDLSGSGRLKCVSTRGVEVENDVTVLDLGALSSIF